MRNTTGHIESIIKGKRIITAGIERLIMGVKVMVKVNILIVKKLTLINETEIDLA